MQKTRTHLELPEFNPSDNVLTDFFNQYIWSHQPIYQQIMQSKVIDHLKIIQDIPNFTLSHYYQYVPASERSSLGHHAEEFGQEDILGNLNHKEELIHIRLVEHTAYPKPNAEVENQDGTAQALDVFYTKLGDIIAKLETATHLSQSLRNTYQNFYKNILQMTADILRTESEHKHTTVHLTDSAVSVICHYWDKEDKHFSAAVLVHYPLSMHNPEERN